MDPGDAVAVNDRLATEFELLKNVDIFNWLEQNLDTISFWSISMFEPYLYLYFSLLPKSPVDALILIAVNVHDRISIAGFSPHKGAIWNNQMCSSVQNWLILFWVHIYLPSYPSVTASSSEMSDSVPVVDSDTEVIIQ